MSSKYKCIGVPMTELPRPSTTDKYSGIGSSLSGRFDSNVIRIDNVNTNLHNYFCLKYIFAGYKN